MARLTVVAGGDAVGAAAPRQQQQARGRRRERIHVRDDEELERKLRQRMLREMNRDHAVVIADGSVDLLHIVRNPDGGVRALAFRTEHELDLIHRSRPHFIYKPDERRGGTPRWQKVPRVKAWLASPRRRMVREVVNIPQPWGDESLPPETLNLWLGWGMAPAPMECERIGGDGYNADWPKACALILEHIMDIWCDRDSRMFKWVVAWFAQLLQQPDKLMGTFLVIQGGQGTGKGIIAQAFARIIGRGYLPIADKRFLVGNFNGILQGRVLVVADELFVRDPEAKNALKNKVSEPSITIEKKGKEPYEIANTARVIQLTNEPHAIDAEADDRRACVLRASERRKVPRDAPQEHPGRPYFNALGREVMGDGPAALFRYLLEVDHRAVDLRTPPTTAALADQKLRSLPPLTRWWYERLCEGVLVGADDARADATATWPRYVTKPIIAASFKAFADRQRLTEHKIPDLSILWSFCTSITEPVRLVRTAKREGSGDRDYQYETRSLDEARRLFAEHLSLPFDMLKWGDAEPGDATEPAIPYPAPMPDKVDEMIPF